MTKNTIPKIANPIIDNLRRKIADRDKEITALSHRVANQINLLSEGDAKISELRDGNAEWQRRCIEHEERVECLESEIKRVVALHDAQATGGGTISLESLDPPKTSDAPMISIGAQRESVKEARDAIAMILDSDCDQDTKRHALSALSTLCNVNGTTISNCNLTGK